MNSTADKVFTDKADSVAASVFKGDKALHLEEFYLANKASELNWKVVVTKLKVQSPANWKP